MASRFLTFGFANQRYSGIKPHLYLKSNDIDIQARGWISLLELSDQKNDIIQL
jgi:hypothetical protein